MADKVKETSPESTPPEVSKEEKKKLFEKFQKAAESEEDARVKFEKAKKDKSDVIEEIYKVCGRGPFEWNGEIVSIAKRGSVFFFRGTRSAVEKIG